MDEIRRERALYVLRVLFEKSSADAPLPMADLCDALTEFGIRAERKAIYRDIDSLREFGFQIRMRRFKGGAGYYVESFPFTQDELDMMRDAVALAEFIPLRAGRDILRKTEMLSPMRKMHGTMAVPIRVKNKQQYPDKYAVLRACLNRGVRVAFSYAGEKRTESHLVTVFGLIRSEKGLSVVAGSTEEKKPLDFYDLEKISAPTATDIAAEDIRAVTGDLDFDLESYLAGK